MGTTFSHRCNNYGYIVNTSGPWEFYRDKKGNRKHYGHPIPMSKESAESGIKGLTGKFYCNKCDKEFEAIIVEFKKSTTNSLDVWGGMAEPLDEYKESTVKCPDCGNSELLFDKRCSGKLDCPKCRKGKFVSFMECIS